MGVPTSEVGYTSVTTRRETTKSMTDMWWHWIKKEKKNLIYNFYSLIQKYIPKPKASRLALGPTQPPLNWYGRRRHFTKGRRR
jgi:hypothetical protein